MKLQTCLVIMAVGHGKPKQNLFLPIQRSYVSLAYGALNESFLTSELSTEKYRYPGNSVNKLYTYFLTSTRHQICFYHFRMNPVLRHFNWTRGQ